MMLIFNILTFLTNIYDLHPEKAREAFVNMVNRLKNPPKSYKEVLDTLSKSGLKEIIEKLMVLV